MVSDSSETVPQTLPGQAGDKVRLRFRKGPSLRLLSHHDLMRTFERMLRRADLPYHRTQGFHPHPRLVFALSLPLGVVGCEEVAELELDEVLPLEELRRRLMAQAPAGLEILSLRRIDRRAGAQVRRLCYRLVPPADRISGLAERIQEVLAETACWVERQRPAVRKVDIRPFLADVRLVPAEAGQASLAVEIDLWLTPTGTARPEEVLRLLALHDLLEAGAVLERSRLELHDELNQPIVEGHA
jgi:radical SAM-linked protein